MYHLYNINPEIMGTVLFHLQISIEISSTWSWRSLSKFYKVEWTLKNVAEGRRHCWWVLEDYLVRVCCSTEYYTEYFSDSENYLVKYTQDTDCCYNIKGSANRYIWNFKQFCGLFSV